MVAGLHGDCGKEPMLAQSYIPVVLLGNLVKHMEFLRQLGKAEIIYEFLLEENLLKWT